MFCYCFIVSPLIFFAHVQHLVSIQEIVDRVRSVKQFVLLPDAGNHRAE